MKRVTNWVTKMVVDVVINWALVDTNEDIIIRKFRNHEDAAVT